MAIGFIGSAPAADEQLVARSLAAVGLLGLVSLPLLLTASPLLNAPLGAPAAIALGYLAAAWSLHFGKNRQAAAWSLVVHGGLVLWTIAYGAISAGTLAGFTAVLLAPLFAAAPALVRRALKHFLLPPAVPYERVEQDRIGLAHEPRSPRPAEVALPVCIPAAESFPALAATRPGCDLGAAIAFGLRRVEPALRAKDICLLRQQSSSLEVDCDAQLCRRIVTTLLDCALAASLPGGTVKVEARRLKGSVLFRVTLEDHQAGDGSPQTFAAALDRTQLHGIVDGAGGTLLTEHAEQGETATLRLASAADRSAQYPAKYA